MDRFRRRRLGWACLALLVMNVTAVICGGLPGSDTRMPCCITLGDDSALPTLEPCCAAEQRQQADPGGFATSVASKIQAASTSTPLAGGALPPVPLQPLIRELQHRFVGPPPDTQLLISVFLI
jgi:hypothetical protein